MNANALPKSLQAQPLISQWVRPRNDGSWDVYSGKVDIGQGITHALRLIAAETLQCDLQSIHMINPSTMHSPDEGMTSGSYSVQDSGTAVRHACAHAKWLVDHEPNRQNIDWHIPIDIEKLVAHSSQTSSQKKTVYRDDLLASVQGPPQFIHDLKLPAMLHGQMVRSHATNTTIDERVWSELKDRASSMTDVVQVVKSNQLIGVVAKTEHAAKQAADFLLNRLQWKVDAHGMQAATLAQQLQKQKADTQIFHESGTEQAATASTSHYSATYTRPYIHHASLAPSCALAVWHSKHRINPASQLPYQLEVWSHSQGIYSLRRDMALAFELPEREVQVHHARGAGCYGQNGADDVAYDAAWLASHVPDQPVRLMWSRRDEMIVSPMGSAMVMELKANITQDHQILNLEHVVWSQGHSSRPGRAATSALFGSWQKENPHPRLDPINVPAAAGAGSERNTITPYRTQHHKVVSHRLLGLPFRTSALRSLGAHGNVFAAESFIDEIAHDRGIDPIDYRLSVLDDPRGVHVLKLVAQHASWKEKKAQLAQKEGRGIGVAYSRYKGNSSYCAVVAEVEVTHTVRVHRLTVACDIGRIVNLDGAVLQIEGGAIQSTSWALKEAMHWNEEGITSIDWDAYPILRFTEIPAVDIHMVMDSPHPSVGAGEATQGPTTAAIANAVFNALGVRVRSLPLTTENIQKAM